MGTAVTPGTCVIHGYHGATTCPKCSTAVQVPVTQPSVVVDSEWYRAQAIHRLATAIDRLAAALEEHRGDR